MEDTWLIVGASVPGNQHIKENIPCQDAYGYRELNKGWGVALVSDGAGSCANSHLGSSFVVEIGLEKAVQMVRKRQWMARNKLPKPLTWRKWAILYFTEVKEALQEYAEENELDFRSLSCTAILMIFYPGGLMTAHIGDGRAGYANADAVWNSAITPYAGEQVGTTVFLTTPQVWDNPNQFIETLLIREPINAFTLMTDGCERGCFEVYKKHPEEEIYYDPNKPYAPFFTTNTQVLLQMSAAGIEQVALHEKWHAFLGAGNEVFEKESDDKTMILGVLHK